MYVYGGSRAQDLVEKCGFTILFAVEKYVRGEMGIYI